MNEEVSTDEEVDSAPKYVTNWVETEEGAELEVRGESDEAQLNLLAQTDNLLEEAIAATSIHPRLFRMAAAAPVTTYVTVQDEGNVGGDVNTPYTKTGNGTTYTDQKPVSYTITATPNHQANTVDFTVEYRIDSSTAGNHELHIQGLNFGEGYNVTNTIPIIVTTEREYPNYRLQLGGVSSTLPGHTLTPPLSLSRNTVRQGKPAIIRFSLDVNDWDSDLSFNGRLGMFDSGTSEKDLDSNANYLKDNSFEHDFNPTFNIEYVERDPEVEETPFETVYRTTSDLEAGQSRVVQ
ncbi:hypothetical protein ACSHWD_00030 [Aerococcus urinaeequi]|uniref:hypothetical protein n=1 Tax=Aerococcus urinaeequi TaxID=51665 RepID=UPI003AAA3201